MERIVEQTLLYDFYGDLLTEHQRQIYEAVVFEDYSLSEVAKEYGVSRQGIHDLIRRCNNTLADYEGKLHLVKRFVSVQEKVKSIHRLSKKNDSLDKQTLLAQIEELSGAILEEL